MGVEYQFSHQPGVFQKHARETHDGGANSRRNPLPGADMKVMQLRWCPAATACTSVPYGRLVPYLKYVVQSAFAYNGTAASWSQSASIRTWSSMYKANHSKLAVTEKCPDILHLHEEERLSGQARPAHLCNSATAWWSVEITSRDGGV